MSLTGPYRMARLRNRRRSADAGAAGRSRARCSQVVLCFLPGYAPSAAGSVERPLAKSGRARACGLCGTAQRKSGQRD